MASLIGALRVTLSADTAEFTSGLSKAERAGQRTGAAIAKSLGGIKTVLGGLLAGVGVSTLAALASRALEYASSLGEVAQQLGITTDELQEYRYAASQAGIEQETMDKALAKLTLTIGKAATGSKQQIAIFDELKIKYRDVNDQVRTAGDLMPEIADALKGIEDPARRAAVETALFGKAGQQLDTLLSGGSAAMNELRDAAHELGIVLSAEQIRKADDTADKLAAIKQVLEARIAGVVADNATSILDLADALAVLAEKAIKALGAWAAFRNSMNARDTMYAKADASIAQRTNLTEPQKNFARRRARELIDGHLGIKDESAGGFLGAIGLRRTTVKGAPKPVATPPAQKPKPKPAATPLDDLDLSGGGGGGGRKKTAGAGKADRAAEDARRNQERYDEDIRSLQIEELRSRETMATEIKERSDLARQQLDLDYESQKAQVASDLAQKDITEGQAAKRLALLATIHNLQAEAIKQDEAADLLVEQYRYLDNLTDIQAERLQIESGLAKTARQRREIEMRILDLALKEQRDRQTRVLNDPNATESQRQGARDSLQAIDRKEPLLREQARRNTMSPLEGYLDSLPRTADEANEALENVAAGGIQSVVDGLADAATGAQSLGATFKNIANQIIADLIRIQIRKAIVSGLSSVIGALGGGMKIGGNTAGLESNFDAVLGTRAPGLAGGGIMSVGGKPGVDTNLLSINGVARARVSANERVAVLPEGMGMGGGGGANITITPSPYFNAVVEQQAARVAGPMAVAGSHMARQGAQSDMMARSRRRIPG